MSLSPHCSVPNSTCVHGVESSGRRKCIGRSLPACSFIVCFGHIPRLRHAKFPVWRTALVIRTGTYESLPMADRIGHNDGDVLSFRMANRIGQKDWAGTYDSLPMADLHWSKRWGRVKFPIAKMIIVYFYTRVYVFVVLLLVCSAFSPRREAGHF